VSSSAHVTLVPWLAGWDYERLDPEVRKGFEVALHTGTAVGLAIGLREYGGSVRQTAIALAPAVVVGLALGDTIERRLGTPATIAAGLIAGALVMLAADRAPQERDAADVDDRDAAALGVAQAVALFPGVSRSGATLATGRLLRFRRPAAAALSRRLMVPVLFGATVFKGFKLARRGLEPELRAPFAAGAATSLLSTLAVLPVARGRLDSVPPGPVAAYRIGLAALVIRRVRQNRRS
jgi:undecaprenyl-diphosphatase